MRFLLLLVVATAAVFVLRQPIKRWPWAFYLLAIALDVMLFASAGTSLPRWLSASIAVLMRRGGLGMVLFTVVMFIGALPRKGRVSRWLRPIRSELSIIACLLIAGHMCSYLGLYFGRLLAGSVLRGSVMASFAVAMVLLVLVVALGITSLRVVKRHMDIRLWRKLQRFSYVFYALVFAHLMLMIGPSALKGAQPALTNSIVYTVTFGVYVVARIWRAVADARDKVDVVEAIRDQGFSS